MADTKIALKPTIACTVVGCGWKMPEGLALVPSIDAMQRLDGTDGRLASIAELNVAAHIVCSRCAREIRRAVPEVMFYNYLGTVNEIARRLKARVDHEAQWIAEWKAVRQAERNRGLSTTISAFAGLNNNAAAKDAAVKAAREKATADKKSALAARNAAMTAAAVSGKR